MPKPTFFNKLAISKRKCKFTKFEDKQKEIGSSVKKYEEEKFKYITGKDKSFAFSYIPQRCQQTHFFVYQSWDKHLLTEEELDKLIWNRDIPKVKSCIQQRIKDKVFKNKQQWIDDMYLAKNGIISIKYISSKYGFDECSSDGRGKTYYNKIVKRIYLCSGGRANFLTRNHRIMGVEHTNGKSGNSLNKEDMEIYRKQIDYVNKLPKRSLQRQIYQPSKVIQELVQVVDGIKPNYIKKDEQGNIKMSKGNSKYILYDMKGFKQHIKLLMDYEQFKNYKDRFNEIINNFPKRSVNQ